MTDDSDKDHLFVYGTLRRASHHPLASLLADNAEWLGFADFRGQLFEIGPYPGAIPSHDTKHRIRGEVYRLRDPATLLPQLDHYEGFGEAFPKPNEFVREMREVLLEGCPLKAWIYLYNHPIDNLALLGHDYLLPAQDV